MTPIVPGNIFSLKFASELEIQKKMQLILIIHMLSAFLIIGTKH